MPVEYCARCRERRLMDVAASRIRVVHRGGSSSLLTTRTYYCRTCGSFLLDGGRPEPDRAAQASSIPERAKKTGARTRRTGTAKQALIVLLAFVLAACSTVPITHRSQLDLIPAPAMLSMSFNQYDQFLSSHQVVTGTPAAEMVQTVGTRIQHAVERYFAEHNDSSQLSGYKWEFHLVQDKEANAWCMPGGKVVVYTGILQYTKDANGLAVVLGHEIAHAVARHGDERMSQALVAQMGGMALAAALSEKPAATQQLFMAAYGVGAQVGVLLPYSRLQESEADHLGLIFMAMAGYDPRGAIEFWQRMASSHQGGSPPELLSTHPADQTRIENIKKLMPEAMKYYKQ